MIKKYFRQTRQQNIRKKYHEIMQLGSFPSLFLFHQSPSCHLHKPPSTVEISIYLQKLKTRKHTKRYSKLYSNLILRKQTQKERWIQGCSPQEIVSVKDTSNNNDAH